MKTIQLTPPQVYESLRETTMTLPVSGCKKDETIKGQNENMKISVTFKVIKASETSVLVERLSP